MSLSSLIKDSLRNPETWHYTSLVPLTGLFLNAPPPPSCLNTLPPLLAQRRLVILDGAYNPSLSSCEALPKTHLSYEPGRNGSSNRLRLSLEKQTCLAIDPLEVLFLTTSSSEQNEATICFEITLGENSRLTLLERHIGGAEPMALRHIKTKITLAPQSKFIHGKVVGPSGFGHTHMAQTSVTVGQGAFYDHFSLFAACGHLNRCETNLFLDGALAETRLHGLMLLKKTEGADLTTCVHHKSPNTTSRQLCKAVLDDKARGVYQGKISVHKDAQKTDAYQLCQALLLSEKAEMNAKPELEILADDVKCSHGTAIGDLDEKALFYLRSRGIEEQAARQLLIEAFAGDFIDQLPSPDLALALKKEVERWLST